MRGLVDPPDLPELIPSALTLDETRGVQLVGAFVDCAVTAETAETSEAAPTSARRFAIRESELRGVTLQSPGATVLELRDVRLKDCDLSNVEAPDASLWRVEVLSTRMVGFRAPGGEVRDLRITDSSLALATFAFGHLRHVSFERVDLSEATFMDTRLDGVEFIDCRLAGADFRGARLKACAIRGSSLDGVLGIDSLRGLRMPWSDVVASVAALAAGLGIEIESSDDA